MRHARLRYAMYRRLRRRGWSRRQAGHYATHAHGSFDAMAEAIAALRRRGREVRF